MSSCNILETWNSESAYFYGLFLADGHLAKYAGVLSTKDEQLVELANSLLPQAGIKKGKTPTGGIFYRVFLDKKSIELMEVRGCPIGRKFDRLPWPDDLPPKYTRDFVRGFFDGDGSISNDRIFISFSSSTVSFLERLELIGRSLFCGKAKIHRGTYSCRRIFYSDMVEVARWCTYMYLYPTTDICLHRKRDHLFSLYGVTKIPDTPSVLD